MCLNDETLELYNKNNRFDYIFAGDVAKGLLTLAKTPDASGVFNLGSGNPRFVKDIIDVLIGEGLLNESDIIDNGDTEEYEASCADISRLKETTEWYPPIQIEEGIKLIIEYEK
jgi:nucleoside-diphosphate-sugar epimerase